MSAKNRQAEGHIYSPRWETKKITEWEYSTPLKLDPQMLDRHGKPKISVSIRRVRRRDGEDTGDIIFVARCPWFAGAINGGDEVIEADSIAELKDAARKRLDEVVLAQSGIEWQDWLEVCVSGKTEVDEGDRGRRWMRASSMKAGIEVSVKRIKRARLPDGSDMVLEDGWRMKPFPKPKKAGEEDSEDRVFGRHVDCEYAYIPATQKNLAELERVGQMIEVAAGRLKAALSQEDISRTLANVRALPFHTGGGE